MADLEKKLICFVIAPIGDQGSDIRRRSDQILKHIITPASVQCGYGEPIRADKIAEAGLITTQIIQHLIDDAIVVADLTDQNPNVFYELAIRHAFRKPVIQLIQAGQRIPFDVAGLRTVEVDHKDLDSAAEATALIAGHMKAIKNQTPHDVESPVSVAVDRETLRSGNPQERELAEVLDGMAKLIHNVADISVAVQALQQTGGFRSIGGAYIYPQGNPVFTTQGNPFYTTGGDSAVRVFGGNLPNAVKVDLSTGKAERFSNRGPVVAADILKSEEEEGKK